jgi:hypothetical protein
MSSEYDVSDVYRVENIVRMFRQDFRRGGGYEANIKTRATMTHGGAPIR